MKLDLDNVYLVKRPSLNVISESAKYVIHIAMPDGSKNYVHCQELGLQDAIVYRDDLIGLELDKESVMINEDETYYRLYIPIIVGENSDKELQFHSRKLNLNDAVFERMQLST